MTKQEFPHLLQPDTIGAMTLREFCDLISEHVADAIRFERTRVAEQLDQMQKQIRFLQANVRTSAARRLVSEAHRDDD